VDRDRPGVKASQWYFEQLWVNGQRATRARTPNKFYYYMLRKLERGLDPLTAGSGFVHRAILGRKQDWRALSPAQKSPAGREQWVSRLEISRNAWWGRTRRATGGRQRWSALGHFSLEQ